MLSGFLDILIKYVVPISAFILSVYNFGVSFVRNRERLEISASPAAYYHTGLYDDHPNSMIIGVNIANLCARPVTIRYVRIRNTDCLSAKGDVYYMLKGMEFADNAVVENVHTKLTTPFIVPAYGCVDGLVLFVRCPQFCDDEDTVCLEFVGTRKTHTRLVSAKLSTTMPSSQLEVVMP